VSRLQELGTEAAVKAAGKHRQEGKNYVMADGDIVNFKFNVTAEKKK
jgi:obg-like ATPase 1